MKGIVHKVPCDVYNHMFYVTFCKDAFERRCKSEIKDSQNGGVLEHDNGEHTIFIRDCDGISYTTIAHEVFHAVDYMLSGKGADISVDGTNEHWAYMIEWLYGRVLDCWDAEYNFKNKRQ